MPDDKPPKTTTIPPPLDPFPTYQTPYPRSNHEHENPFIQFRRFADEQVSSFFHGIPNLFGFHTREIDDLMRRRHEMEEGWRKQFEQEMEEIRHETEKSRAAVQKAMEESWARSTDVSAPSSVTPSSPSSPWWTRGNAANCPALNRPESQQNTRKCPAMYNDAGQPRTELDMYDTSLAKVDKQSHPASKDAWFDWLTPGDLRSKRSDGNNNHASNDRSHTSYTRYSMFGARHMDPFDNPDQTIPWLLLSPYSPIYLCNPAQSRIFRVRIQDSEEAPLQISKPKYFERWYSDVDERMARQLPWADAFEDLVSLQQTGRMVDRNYSTLRTPPTWIHDMVSRGSLGSRWGFNDEGMLIKRVNDHSTVETPANMKDRCRRRRERRWGPWRRFEEVETSPKNEENEKIEDSIDKIVDDLPESIARSPVFGGILSAADSIVSAVEQSFEDAMNYTPEQESSEPDQNTATEVDDFDPGYQSAPAASSDFYESSTSLSSSYSAQEPSSIISTLTTTVTRTLPDGSIETKRVFKKRFADGTEESDESTEVKNAPYRSNPAQVVDKETQTLPPKVEMASAIQPPPAASLEKADVERLRNTYGAQVFQRDPSFSDEMQPAPVSVPNPQQRRGGGWFWTR